MGRQKIVYVPLDERPCNYNFPLFLYEESAIEVVNVPKAFMGDNKIPANHEKIVDFLLKETVDASGLVISIDTLVYGGIVPSRIHHLDSEELKNRLSLLTLLKKNNPKLIIYAFSLIMRCPQYSLSVEEPDYYDECGFEIFRKGFLTHKEKLGIINEKEKEELSKIYIKDEYMQDYIARRSKNIELNLTTLDYLNNKIIDFLIFPQDDSAEYGYTAMDQEKVRTKIDKCKLHLSAYMYPGADEVGLTLLSRMQNTLLNKKFRVYIKYPAITSGMIIPCLEDRYLDTSIRYQILAAGGIVVDSETEADTILIASIGAKEMIPHPDQVKTRGVSVYANYVETFEYMRYYIDKKPIILADLTYLNGGNLELFEQLVANNLEMKLAAYAGWNTAANTLGTCIAHGFNYLINGNTKTHQEFMLMRYVEDIAYCSIVRGEVSKDLAKFEGNYFDVSKRLGDVEAEVRRQLEDFVRNYLSKYNLQLTTVKLPWKRMFEVEIQVKL